MSDFNLPPGVSLGMIDEALDEPRPRPSWRSRLWLLGYEVIARIKAPFRRHATRAGWIDPYLPDFSDCE